MTSTADQTVSLGTADDSRRISTLLGLLFGLAGMGSSSAAVTLPLLGDDLGVDAGLAAWTISLYVLMLAVTTALYGRISDLVGVRAPLLAGLILMSIGALVAAIAPTFEVLLGARLVQGAGAAAVPTWVSPCCPRGTAARSAASPSVASPASLPRSAASAR